jgi:hypothetical protein
MVSFMGSSLRLLSLAAGLAIALPTAASACANADHDLVEYGPRNGADASMSGLGGAAPISEDPCAPEFCPASTVGAPCCVTRQGPCGVDLGMGCQVPAGPDE